MENSLSFGTQNGNFLGNWLTAAIHCPGGLMVQEFPWKKSLFAVRARPITWLTLKFWITVSRLYTILTSMQSQPDKPRNNFEIRWKYRNSGYNFLGTMSQFEDWCQFTNRLMVFVEPISKTLLRRASFVSPTSLTLMLLAFGILSCSEWKHAFFVSKSNSV